MKKKRPVESNMMGMSNALTTDAKKRRDSYRNKRTAKSAVLVCVSAVALLAAAVFIFSFMSTSVIPTLTIEAGSEMVSASDFFENNVRAFFVGNDEVDTAKPDKYDLTVRKGIILYKVTLNVCDTKAPTAKPKNIRIRQGSKQLSAIDFVKNVSDNTEVEASFVNEPDFNTLGDSNVGIILRDLGGNESRFESKLTVYPEEIEPSVSIEAGKKTLSVNDFLKAGATGCETDTVITEIDDDFYHKVGSTKIEIMYNNAVYTVEVTVEDTLAPTASVINKTTYKDVPLAAEDFIRELRDETQVSVSYIDSPDFSKTGSNVIELLLEDSGKNTSVYKAILTVIPDTEKPEITAFDRTVYLGDNIRFSEGVKATDNCDGEIDFTVDIGDFDKTTAGVYPIKFTATDKAGNVAEKTVNFTLTRKKYIEYTQEYINSNFNALYARIIGDDMTDKEKMRAIYDYIRENISYNGTSEKSDWEQEAYRGIRSKQGDSFTFYAISRKLLTMAGIENKPVERINSDSSHYWNMVYYQGEWYHFDTCPHYKDYPIDSFMLTDEEAALYSEKTGGYYTYD